MKSDLPQHPETSLCRDCGAAVDYHYCAVCGQETTLHVPSAFEFIHEFVVHYVALEGKLWRTLGLLLFRPGMLSAEYIAGRRARYVQPLRVYLSFSILFFAVLKLSAFPVANADGTDADIITLSEPAPAIKGKGKAALVPDAAAQLQSDLKKDNIDLTLSPHIKAKIQAFFDQPAKLRNTLLVDAFFKYVPYAMFLLMPVFALYLKLLYLGSGRRYGEHLLFALHTNAFAYIMIGLAALNPLGAGNVLLMLWLAAYLPLAMRRYYGGSRLATAGRWSLLMLLHVLSIGVAIIGVFGLVMLR